LSSRRCHGLQPVFAFGIYFDFILSLYIFAF